MYSEQKKNKMHIAHSIALSIDYFTSGFLFDLKFLVNGAVVDCFFNYSFGVSVLSVMPLLHSAVDASNPMAFTSIIFAVGPYNF